MAQRHKRVANPSSTRLHDNDKYDNVDNEVDRVAVCLLAFVSIKHTSPLALPSWKIRGWESRVSATLEVGRNYEVFPRRNELASLQQFYICLASDYWTNEQNNLQQQLELATLELRHVDKGKRNSPVLPPASLNLKNGPTPNSLPVDHVALVLTPDEVLKRARVVEWSAGGRHLTVELLEAGGFGRTSSSRVYTPLTSSPLGHAVRQTTPPSVFVCSLEKRWFERLTDEQNKQADYFFRELLTGNSLSMGNSAKLKPFHLEVRERLENGRYVVGNLKNEHFTFDAAFDFFGLRRRSAFVAPEITVGDCFPVMLSDTPNVALENFKKFGKFDVQLWPTKARQVFEKIDTPMMQVNEARLRVGEPLLALFESNDLSGYQRVELSRWPQVLERGKAAAADFQKRWRSRDEVDVQLVDYNGVDSPAPQRKVSLDKLYRIETDDEFAEADKEEARTEKWGQSSMPRLGLTIRAVDVDVKKMIEAPADFMVKFLDKEGDNCWKVSLA